jgi:hypothetical protein
LPLFSPRCRTQAHRFNVGNRPREAHAQEAMQPPATRPPRYRPNGANTGVKVLAVPIRLARLHGSFSLCR